MFLLYHQPTKIYILSILLMKFLAINIELFGVLWQNKNKNLLVVYHQEVFVFIWITTRRFLFLFWSPLGGFCFYLNNSISYTLIWQFFFCFNWKKLSKWRAKKWSKLSIFHQQTTENASSRKLKNQKWLCQPLVHTVIGRTRALRALVLSITVWTCGWQNPFPVFQLPGKDTVP